MDVKKVLNPGTKILLSNGIGITVFPISFKQIQRFSKRIVSTLQTLADVKVPKGMSFAKAMQAAAAPFFFDELFDLLIASIKVDEGAKFDPGDMFHWDVATVIEAFFIENFEGEEKLRPWKLAVDRLAITATGNPMDWSKLNQAKSALTLVTPSSSSSEKDTVEQTSATQDNPDSRTTDGVTSSSASG